MKWAVFAFLSWAGKCDFAAFRCNLAYGVKKRFLLNHSQGSLIRLIVLLSNRVSIRKNNPSL